MGDMMGCAKVSAALASTPPAGFADSMQKIRLECDGHRRTAQSVADVAAARKEIGPAWPGRRRSGDGSNTELNQEEGIT